MATVKTIKPLGGGDYTTLQAWEDWADDQASADQWAECYAGGDLGPLNFQGWTATPTAVLYPRVYVPKAERHVAKEETGAYLEGTIQSISQIGYIRIEGLRIITNPTYSYGIYAQVANNWLIDSCLIRMVSGVNDGIYVVSVQFSPETIVTIQNNIINGLTIGVAGIHISASCGAGDSTATVYIYNCDSFNNTQYGIRLEGATLGEPFLTNGYVVATIKNNMCGANGTADYSDNGINITATGSYNMSSDATGDDWGATGAKINVPAGGIVINNSNDWHLQDASPAINAGNTIATFDWDCLHDSGDNWRPQGSAWDIGSVEGGMTFRPRGVGLMFPHI